MSAERGSDDQDVEQSAPRNAPASQKRGAFDFLGKTPVTSRRWLPFVVATCLAIYVLIVSLQQTDVGADLIWYGWVIFIAYTAALCGYYLVHLVGSFFKIPKSPGFYFFLPLYVLFPVWVWFQLIAALSEWVRAVLAGAGGVIVAVFVFLLHRWFDNKYIDAKLRETGKLYGDYGQEDSMRMLRALKLSALAFMLVSWIASSTLELWFRPSSLQLALPPLERSRAVGAPWHDIQVGLALSGGGYRAALMHAGVLKALDERRVPVTHLSTVSGGSIIGAFYALGGKPEEFRDAVIAGRLSLKQSLANFWNLVRLPFPAEVPYLGIKLLPRYQFDRADAQADLLDSVLLNGKQLKDLNISSYPRLQLSATDLGTGSAVGITREDIILRPMPWTFLQAFKVGAAAGLMEPVMRRRPGAAGTERIARLVAASGAFPGAFNPLRVELQAPDSDYPGQALVLTDGGVTDNSGIGLLLARHNAPVGDQTPDWRVDILLASDGSKPFEVTEELSGFDRISRVIDIIHAGSGWHETSDMRRYFPLPEVISLRPLELDENCIQDSIPGGAVNLGMHCGMAVPEVWTFLNTSTLTDSFPADQAKHLFKLGQLLVEHSWPQIESSLNEFVAKR